MEAHTKKYLYASICGVLAVLTSWTIIGGIVFALIGIGFLVQGYEEKHGDRPWWTKSFVTLYRERKSDPDEEESGEEVNGEEELPAEA